MADIDGMWRLEVATLAGARRYDLTLTTDGASVTGTAVGATGPILIRNGRINGDLLEFTLDLVSPIATSIVFSLTVVGDRLSGAARSGLFPSSTVLGTRTG